MSGLSASFNVNDPLYVQNTFYVDSKFGTAAPPAEGQRPDRAFLSGNDAVTAAINHLQGGSDIAVVRFRPGVHVVYQRDHYSDRGALIIHTEPGANIYVVRDVPLSDPTDSFITWDFNNAYGDAIVCGEGKWHWGQTSYQVGTGFPPYRTVFQVLGANVGSALVPNEANRIHFEAGEFHAPRNTTTIQSISFIRIAGDNYDSHDITIKSKLLTFFHGAPESAFVSHRSTTSTHLQIDVVRADMGNAALVHNEGSSQLHVSYRCPQHYGFNLTSDGQFVDFRLLGGSAIHPIRDNLFTYGIVNLNCILHPGSGQSHIHCGSDAPQFNSYGAMVNTSGHVIFSGGEIIFTGQTPDERQNWVNTLRWGESRACIEFDFNTYPLINFANSGFALEGQTIRSFDVRVLSPLTPGVTIRFGTSLSPFLTAAVNTTTLNSLVYTTTPIVVTGPAYNVTSSFEQFSINRVSGPLLTQGKIQLIPRLVGPLYT